MAQTALFMSVNFLPVFIEAYKGHHCLWHRKSKDYCNKRKREEAYQNLVELTKRVIPNSSVDIVKKKIDVIRGCFRKEMHKVKRSDKSKPYVPKLWYFKMLLFLTSQDEEDEEEVVRASSSTMASPPEDADVRYDMTDEPDQDSALELYASHSYEEDSHLYPSAFAPASSYARKRYREEQSNGYAPLEDSMPFLDSKEDEYDKVGGNVAAKLRKMEPTQRLYAEHLINQVLFKGMLSKLNENSTVDGSY